MAGKNFSHERPCFDINPLTTRKKMLIPRYFGQIIHFIISACNYSYCIVLHKGSTV